MLWRADFKTEDIAKKAIKGFERKQLAVRSLADLDAERLTEKMFKQMFDQDSKQVKQVKNSKALLSVFAIGLHSKITVEYQTQATLRTVLSATCAII